METTKEKQNSTYKTMKDSFGYKNVFNSPRLLKIVVSSGTGKRSRTDSKYNEFVSDKLSKITGQKPSSRGAKKSVASFKVRQGDVIGQMVTLRGNRMYAFLDKLIHVAFPRTKDFRGIKRTSVDTMGNLTTGIKEHTIFPETGDEELKNIFSMSITFVSTAKNKKEAIAFYSHLGIPFSKIDV